MKYSYMYVYARMIFAAVLSPAIKIFHRHLGPNLLIFRGESFTDILRWFYDISLRKNTDQGDFLLKRAVRAVARSFIKINRIGGVMINVLAPSVIDCGFKPQVNQRI
jgi:hypothetical protein